MAPPTFKQAGDTLCLSGRELAALLGISVQRVKQARLDPQAAGYRAPPAGWEGKLLQVARTRGKELQALALALEAQGGA